MHNSLCILNITYVEIMFTHDSGLERALTWLMRALDLEEVLYEIPHLMLIALHAI